MKNIVIFRGQWRQVSSILVKKFGYGMSMTPVRAFLLIIILFNGVIFENHSYAFGQRRMSRRLENLATQWSTGIGPDSTEYGALFQAFVLASDHKKDQKKLHELRERAFLVAIKVTESEMDEDQREQFVHHWEKAYYEILKLRTYHEFDDSLEYLGELLASARIEHRPHFESTIRKLLNHYNPASEKLVEVFNGTGAGELPTDLEFIRAYARVQLYRNLDELSEAIDRDGITSGSERGELYVTIYRGLNSYVSDLHARAEKLKGISQAHGLYGTDGANVVFERNLEVLREATSESQPVTGFARFYQIFNALEVTRAINPKHPGVRAAERRMSDVYGWTASGTEYEPPVLRGVVSEEPRLSTPRTGHLTVVGKACAGLFSAELVRGRGRGPRARSFRRSGSAGGFSISRPTSGT